MARMSVMLALLCSLSCAHAFQAVAPLPGLPQHARGAPGPADDDDLTMCGLSLDGPA